MEDVEGKLKSNRFTFEHSSDWQVGRMNLHIYNKDLPCSSMSLECGVVDPDNFGEYAFLARGYLSSDKLRNMSSGYSVYTPHAGINITPAVKELRSGIAMYLPKLVPQFNALRVASGMIEIKNGCLSVKGCRLLAAGKVKFRAKQERCTGYFDQMVSNRTHCVRPPRGYNRQRCGDIAHARKKLHYEVLWVGDYGPYISFQHFIIDKLPHILMAYDMLKGNHKAKLLLHVDQRGIEVLRYLGLDVKRFVDISTQRSFCADKLWMHAPLPGKFGGSDRPPELFHQLALAFQERRNQLEEGKKVTRDKVIVLTRAADHNSISNMKELLARLRKTGMQVLQVDAASRSIVYLSKIMSGARVVVGVHGGQMANIIFAVPDRGTAVIEIAGRQTPFKTYYYGGQAAALDYHVVPRLCKTRSGVVMHPTDRTRGKCQGKLFVDIPSFQRALSAVSW